MYTLLYKFDKKYAIIDHTKMTCFRAHKTTRCCVERGIGQLKKRWGILQGEIRMEPEKVCQ